LKAESSAEDADLQDLIRTGRLEAIYRQGSIKGAYEAYPEDREQSFRALAWLAEERRDFEGLSELIGLHVRREPADPWIGYFTALREEAAGNFTAAITALTPAEQSDDQSLQMLCTRLKTELYIKSANIDQAYTTGGKPQEAFQRIASRLVELNDWEQLLDLAKVHGAAVPADAMSLYYATKARWHLGLHDQLIQTLTPWPKDKLNSLDQAWSAEIGELLVRSWLRGQASEEARKAAEMIRDELGLSQPLVIAELKLGNLQRAKELLADPLVGREFFQQELQFDAECASVLTEPEFAELRKRYALDRPTEYSRRSASLVLFLQQPLDEMVWREAFDLAAGDAAGLAREIPATGHASGSGGRTGRLIELPGGTLILTASAAPYCDAKSVPADKLAADSPLRKALDQHAAWIAIDLSLADEQAPAKELEQAAQKLAAALATDGSLAIYAERPRSAPPRFVLADAEVREQLASGVFLAADGASERGAIYLSESSTEGEAEKAEIQEWPQRRQALDELSDAARVENPAGHARVRVRFERGHAREELWLNVVRSKRGLYESEKLIGELTADSHLWPHLREGERIRLSAYEPLEVQPVE
jgi:hypothetical protein